VRLLTAGNSAEADRCWSIQSSSYLPQYLLWNVWFNSMVRHWVEAFQSSVCAQLAYS